MLLLCRFRRILKLLIIDYLSHPSVSVSVNKEPKRKSMSKGSMKYLLLTALAFTLMGLGWYLMGIIGGLYKIGGLLSFIAGFCIGVSLYGEKWNWFQ